MMEKMPLPMGSLQYNITVSTALLDLRATNKT